MASQWGGFREVVPDTEVTAIIDAGCEEYGRLDEAWMALHWDLSRSGSTMGVGSRNDENLRLYVQSDDPVAGIPAIWVLYRVTTDQIQIMRARLVAPIAEEE